MCNNRVFAVYNGGVVTAFIEHAGIYAENVCKIYGPVKRPLVGTDDDGVVLVNNQILFHAQKRTDKLVGRRKIVKALYGHRILHSGVMGVECDKVGDTHIHQFLYGISAVQGFTAVSLVLPSFVEKGHDDIDTVRLAVYGGDNPL